MTAIKDFIVAIELGSSKIMGIAGKKNNDGSIQVLAYACEEASAFIRKGIIYNINKTALGLTSIINKLEEQLNSEIAKVYVGIGGQSLHSKKNFIMEHLNKDTVISDDIVEHLIRANQQTRYPDLDILNVIPQEYKVKTKTLLDPVGVMGDQIEGHFLNIVARSAVKRNIQTCFEQADIQIAGFFISPIVSADSVLSEVEKRSGCALVDFGADTTTVAIYKNSILRHLAVIPLGSSNITKDICSLHIEECDAENLKINYSSALTLPGENTDDDRYPVNESSTIQAKTLNDVVGARMEEIVANVRNQIRISTGHDKLLSGIILTGGGSNLKNIQEAFRQTNEITKVRIANFVHYEIKATNPEILIKDGRRNTLFALLNEGKDNCCLQEKIEKTPQPTDLFEQMEMEKNNKEKEEAEQREAEERARKEREAAEAAAAAEEENRRRKEAETARAKANAAALAKIKENAETVSQALQKLDTALNEVKIAQKEKKTKAAQQANKTAIAGIKEAQNAQNNAKLTLKDITDEALLSEARTIIGNIDDMIETAEQTKKEVANINEQTKDENSFFGRFKTFATDLMND